MSICLFDWLTVISSIDCRIRCLYSYEISVIGVYFPNEFVQNDFHSTDGNNNSDSRLRVLRVLNE